MAVRAVAMELAPYPSLITLMVRGSYENESVAGVEKRLGIFISIIL